MDTGAVDRADPRPPNTTRGSTLLAVAALVAYLALWAAYRLQSGGLDTIDSWVLDPLYDVGVSRPGWTHAWDVFCTIFGPRAFRLAGAVVIVVAAARRNMRATVFLLVVIELSGVVTEVAKKLANRPRPETALTFAFGTAFPSGHAVGVTATVLALLAVSAGLLGPRARIAMTALGVLVIVTVGAGRVVLNVHHPSDVIAGWALGYLWFWIWLAVIRPPPLRPSRAGAGLVSGEAVGETPEEHGSER